MSLFTHISYIMLCLCYILFYILVIKYKFKDICTFKFFLLKNLSKKWEDKIWVQKQLICPELIIKISAIFVLSRNMFFKWMSCKKIILNSWKVKSIFITKWEVFVSSSDSPEENVLLPPRPLAGCSSLGGRGFLAVGTSCCRLRPR